MSNKQNKYKLVVTASINMTFLEIENINKSNLKYGTILDWKSHQAFINKLM